MIELQRKAWDTSSQLYSVGYALQSIGDLLGANGSEHHINKKLENGLHHAVHALGSFVLQCGGELAEFSDPDEVQFVPASHALSLAEGAASELANVGEAFTATRAVLKALVDSLPSGGVEHELAGCALGHCQEWELRAADSAKQLHAQLSGLKTGCSGASEAVQEVQVCA